MNVFGKSARLVMLLTAGAAAATAQIAVAVMPPRIVVLRADGKILLGRLDDPAGILRPIATDYDICTDMAAGSVNGNLAIFVASSRPSASGGGPMTTAVKWYSEDGKLLKTWPRVYTQLTGIAFDSTQGLVYVDSRDNRVFPISVGAKEMSKPLTVARLNQGGSMAVDSMHHRLFVSDTAYGKVYLMDLKTGEVQEVASDLGTVSALAFDENRGVLYISDAEGKLLKVNPDSKVHMSRITTSIQLREPLGLALLPDGDLLIGDRSTKLVSRIHPSGELVRQFR